MDRDRKSRDMLIDAMRRALSGQNDGDAKFERISSCWKDLDQTERSALLQLRNWAEDRPLRTQFAGHARYSQQRMQHLLGALESTV